MDIGLLILRVVLGFTMAAHGAQKLFGWFGGYGLAGTGGFFEKLGFRPGKLQAAVAGLAEFGGGLLLAAGLATPVASGLIIMVMVVAIAAIHLPKGFFATGGGYEFNLLIIAAAAALAFVGPGAYSIDAVEQFLTAGVTPGLAAVIGGSVLAGIALLARKAPAPAPAAST